MDSSKRFYLILLVLVALWCTLIIAAPILKRVQGQEYVASTIYSLLSRVCHQMDARSFRVDGEKFGVCIRCSAIYFSFLIGLIAMPFIKPIKTLVIPGRRYLLILLAPILLDAVLNDAGMLASTSFTRILTGSLLGFALPWYVVPPFIEACVQLKARHSGHRSPS